MCVKSESDRRKDESVPNNPNRQRRNRSCKKSQESGHARKTVLADLSSAATWAMKQTRDTDMLAYGCARTRMSRRIQVSQKLQCATAVSVHRQNPSQCDCARIACVVCNVHVFCTTSLSSKGWCSTGETTVWAKLRCSTPQRRTSVNASTPFQRGGCRSRWDFLLACAARKRGAISWKTM